MEPVILHEPESVYHAQTGARYVSSHLLGQVRADGPQVVLAQRTEEYSPAFRIGSMAHCLILEGDEEFDRRYERGGVVNDATGKLYGGSTQAHRDYEVAMGRQFVTPTEERMLCAMRDAVCAHGGAGPLLTDGEPEMVVRTPYAGLKCQGRIDWLRSDSAIVDLKTTRSVADFNADFHKYGYFHQMAFYQALIAIARRTSDLPKVYVIAVEKREDHPGVGVWLLFPDALSEFRLDNALTMKLLFDFIQTRSETCPTREMLSAT